MGRGGDPAGAAAPAALLDALGEAAGDTLVAVLAFGSRVTGAGPTARSAWDLFVVVSDYDRFYRAAARRLGWKRSPRLLAALNRVLPPNVCRLTEPDGPGAKLFVVTERDLAAAVAPGARDHFCRARLAQRVERLWERDAAAGARMDDALASARRVLVPWMRPFLRGPFDVEDFVQGLLVVSYRTEVRPESGGRAAEVFTAQRGDLGRRFAPVLAAAREDGTLVADGTRFRWARPAGTIERTAGRLGLLTARVRSTLRWPKYLMTFDGWLDYIVAKAERRIGVTLDLTPRERRFPLLLLWPKFFRTLRARRRPPGSRRGTPPSPGGSR